MRKIKIKYFINAWENFSCGTGFAVEDSSKCMTLYEYYKNDAPQKFATIWYVHEL